MKQSLSFILVLFSLTIGSTAICKNKSQTMATLQQQLKKDPDNLNIRQKLANSLYKNKKYTEVSAVLEPYIDELKLKSLKTLSNSYRELKKHKDEERVLKLILEKRPESSKVFYALALTQKKQGHMDQAISSLRSSIKNNTKFKQAHIALFKLFETQKNYYEARNTIKDMIKLFGHTKKYQSAMCRYYALDGFLEEALNHCKTAIEKDPKNPANYIFLSQSYLEKKKQKEGQKILKTAAKLFPKSEPVLSALGQFYLKKENYASALRFYEKAVSINPSSAQAQIGLAESAFGNNKYEQALQSFSKSCKLDLNREYDVLQRFRRATGQLRQQSNYRWMTKYSTALYSCRGSK